MVARMNPVTVIVRSRITNSSGIRLVLVNALLISTHTSTYGGFAYVGIDEESAER
jgi:predicted ATP-grasp superfamily ATP-dependent carboligase